MNVAGDTARAAALGYVVMLGNCGGLISTWSFLPSDAPNYPYVVAPSPSRQLFLTNFL